MGKPASTKAAINIGNSIYAESAFSVVASLGNKEPGFLSDAELISMLFSLDLAAARDWLNQSGSIREVINSSEMGRALMELASRYLFENVKRGEGMNEPDAVKDYLKLKIRDRHSEVFGVIFLDNRHRVIECKEMFYGTIDGASVYPREVVREALKYNCAACIFYHNHPSGIAEPSQADERITQKLKEALRLIDVRVLDHLIVGDAVVSMAERGMI